MAEKKFKSGAKSSGNKPSYHLIPLTMFRRTALRFDLGIAHGYEANNWRKGLTDKDFILDRLNHALEHLKLAMKAIENDEIETDDNLGAVTCNVSMAMEYQLVNELHPRGEND